MSDLTVFIVDDEPMAAQLHRMFVEGTPGFEVIGLASSGEEAVSMMMDAPPDVVLLDLQLPGISGVDVLRHLRSRLGDDVDVIAVTADRRARSVSQMRMLGVSHYLAKPFSVRELRHRLRSVARVRGDLASLRSFADQAEIDAAMRSGFTKRDELIDPGEDPADKDIQAGHPLDALRAAAELVISERGHAPDFTLHSLADALHISARQLQRAFARGTRSVQDAIRDHRVGMSGMLLVGADRPTVAEVARRSGFGSLRTMRRAYQEVHGMSPAQWRAAHETEVGSGSGLRREEDRSRRGHPSPDHSTRVRRNVGEDAGKDEAARGYWGFRRAPHLRPQQEGAATGTALQGGIGGANDVSSP